MGFAVLLWYKLWGAGFGFEDLLCTPEISGEMGGDLCPQQRHSKTSYFYGIPSSLQPVSSSCYILSFGFISALGAGIVVLSCPGSELLSALLYYSKQ